MFNKKVNVVFEKNSMGCVLDILNRYGILKERTNIQVMPTSQGVELYGISLRAPRKSIKQFKEFCSELTRTNVLIY